MNNLDETLEPYHKIYEDVRKIFNGESIYILGEYAGQTNNVTDNQLIELEQYAKRFDGEENRGKLRTILIILKPYKNHYLIKDTANLLADQLRATSKNGFI